MQAVPADRGMWLPLESESSEVIDVGAALKIRPHQQHVDRFSKILGRLLLRADAMVFLTADQGSETSLNAR